MPPLAPGILVDLTVSHETLQGVTTFFQFAREFDDLIRVSPFAFGSFVNELLFCRATDDEVGDAAGECEPIVILGEIHIGILRTLLTEEATILVWNWLRGLPRRRMLPIERARLRML